MHDAHEFLRSLTLVLVVAGLTTVIFQRLKQPVVLGYILTGLIVGPHVPVPLVADRNIIQTLSELGVILLMFGLGLEFSLGKLVRVGPAAGFTALIQSALMAWLGFLTGRLFGWTVMESIFTGAIIAMSSTTIIAKVFDEQRVGGRLRELVVGVLLVEDLMAVVFMAALVAVASGTGLSAGALAGSAGRLAGFLVLLIAGGLLLVPRIMRMVGKIATPETTLVASMGICFGTALLALDAGYSVALGAFLSGSLIAESGKGEPIEHLIRPVRDMFAAIFFVSVGMLIDPALVMQNWKAVLVLTLIVVIGKSLAVAFGAFLTGSGPRTAIEAGMSLSQIGEFSFIIAGLGLSLGATRSFLYPVAVAVSAVTTLTTPWLIRRAGPVAAYVDRKLPRPFQTLASLYGAWIEGMRGTPLGARHRGIGRLVRLLLLDVLLLTGLIVGVALGYERISGLARQILGVGTTPAHLVVLGSAALLAIPLMMGVGRLARRVGLDLAEIALPPPDKGADLEAAPRTALISTLQFGVVLLCSLLILALTQWVLPSYAGPPVLLVLLIGFGIALWKSAANLHGHVQAGAQAVVAALSSAARRERDQSVRSPVESLLHGLGVPVAVTVGAASPAVGRSLSELNLRGRTGATVVAISRGTNAILSPDASERLEANDVLALAGTADALDAARVLLVERAS